MFSPDAAVCTSPGNTPESSNLASNLARRAFLLGLVLVTSCGVTDWQRFRDRASAAHADLTSPAMTKAICDAGAQTSACDRYRQKEVRR